MASEKRRTNISINQDTWDRLMQYGFENHIPGGLTGVIEHIAWNTIKVKNAQVRGQISTEELAKKRR